MTAKLNIVTRYIYKIPISCLTGHVVPEKTIANQATVQHSTLLAPVMGSGATSPGLLRRSPLLRTKNLHGIPAEYGVSKLRSVPSLTQLLIYLYKLWQLWVIFSFLKIL